MGEGVVDEDEVGQADVVDELRDHGGPEPARPASTPASPRSRRERHRPRGRRPESGSLEGPEQDGPEPAPTSTTSPPRRHNILADAARSPSRRRGRSWWSKRRSRDREWRQPARRAGRAERGSMRGQHPHGRAGIDGSAPAGAAGSRSASATGWAPRSRIGPTSSVAQTRQRPRAEGGGSCTRAPLVRRAGRTSSCSLARRRGSVSMRVLVTGHRGYIGAVLTPMLLAGGSRGRRARQRPLSSAARSATRSDSPTSRPSLRKDIRDVEARRPRGLRRGHPPRGPVERPARRPQPRADLRHQSPRHRSALAELAKEAGVDALPLLLLVQQLRRGRRSDLLDETARSIRSPPTASRRCCAERDVAALADDAFCPTFLRNATAYGVSPRLRFDIVLNNLVAWAVHDGPGASQERRHARGGRSSTSRTSPGRSSRSSRRRARRSTTRRSTSGRRARTTRSATSPRSSREVVPGCHVEFAEGAGPDTRSYRVDFDKIAERLPGSSRAGPRARAPSELLEAYRTVGLTLAEFEGERYQRIAHVRSLIARGSLGPDLRFRDQAVPDAVA